MIFIDRLSDTVSNGENSDDQSACCHGESGNLRSIDKAFYIPVNEITLNQTSFSTLTEKFGQPDFSVQTASFEIPLSETEPEPLQDSKLY